MAEALSRWSRLWSRRQHESCWSISRPEIVRRWRRLVLLMKLLSLGVSVRCRMSLCRAVVIPIVGADSHAVVLIVDVHALLVREVRQGTCSPERARGKVLAEVMFDHGREANELRVRECLLGCVPARGIGMEHGANEPLCYRGSREPKVRETDSRVLGNCCLRPRVVPLSGTVSRIGRGSWSQPLSFVGRVLSCRLT